MQTSREKLFFPFFIARKIPIIDLGVVLTIPHQSRAFLALVVRSEKISVARRMSTEAEKRKSFRLWRVEKLHKESWNECAGGRSLWLWNSMVRHTNHFLSLCATFFRFSLLFPTKKEKRENRMWWWIFFLSPLRCGFEGIFTVCRVSEGCGIVRRWC